MAEKDLEKNEGMDEELEKALDRALQSLNKSAGYDEEETDEEDEYGEEQEEEEEEPAPKKKIKKSRDEEDEPDFEALSKSLPDAITEHEGAEEIIDAMPFVKALLESTEEQISSLVKAVISLTDEVDEMKKSIAANGKVGYLQAKLVKSMHEEVRQLGGQPLPPKSTLGKGLTVIRKSEDGTENKTQLTPMAALDKLTELHKAKRISLNEVIASESKIQKGLALPSHIERLLSE